MTNQDCNYNSQVSIATARTPSPISWSAVLVSDGDEVDLLVPGSVDDAEREAGNQPLAIVPAQRRAAGRRRRDPLRGLFDRSKEAQAEAFEARLVEGD